MRLEIGNIMIKDVQFGAKTEVNEGILFVNKDELAQIAGQWVCDQLIAAQYFFTHSPEKLNN